ncbi:MAG: hypothetical protein RR844_09465 [Clostridium sp.]|uniref:hypothetical protein n=1 Tax=Clostridium sp. TaxID=1506 RepID=UPI002FCC43BF
MFVCQKCGAKFERDTHYLYILELQNCINALMFGRKIVDLCGNCNHFEYEK